ncbi:MAG: CNNM domain-containing protein [Arachnia sp.]
MSIVMEATVGGWAAVAWTAGLIALSAFFVSVEFALMAAKPHRLADAAHRSASARAALRNSAELTLLLAGSQLGITLCTLALGAITKPAVHDALLPLIEALGAPAAAADVASFILALILVTFLHLVVGEMAPKSWAIAHPEQSAILLSLPMRAFMFLVRPVLRMMNHAANVLVRLAGATPVEGIEGSQDASSLRQLVEHSANVGALDVLYQASLRSALELRDLTVRDVLPDGQDLTAVSPTATVADVQSATREHGHVRVLVREAGTTIGVVHVRDTLAETDLSTPITGLIRDAVRLPADTALAAALGTIRQQRTQLAVVTHGAAEVGVVTLDDVLPRLMPSALITEAQATTD